MITFLFQNGWTLKTIHALLTNLHANIHAILELHCGKVGGGIDPVTEVTVKLTCYVKTADTVHMGLCMCDQALFLIFQVGPGDKDMQLGAPEIL